MPSIIIGDEQFPFPDNYTFGDFALVELVTGYAGDEFGQILLSEEGTRLPTRAFLGIVAVAVWRKHPSWTIDRVGQFVHGLDPDAVDVLPDKEEETDPTSPKSPPKSEPPGTGETSNDSPDASDQSKGEPSSG